MRNSFAAFALLALIVIATGKTFAGTPASTGTPAAATATPTSETTIALPTEAPPAPPASGLTDGVTVTSHSRYIWPATGEITSYFGPGHPLGIDIALDPGADSPVVASAAGTVSFAGGDPCCSYGYHVIVQHDDGMSTLYGHFSKILVAEGDHVEQGQVLGLGGATGDADGKHVHFEIHDADDYVVDPLRFLPWSQYQPPEGSASCPDGTVRLDAASDVSLDLSGSLADGESLGDVSISGLGQGFPTPGVSLDGPSTVNIAVEPAPVATGQTYRFALALKVAGADSEREIDCTLAVRTNATLANSAATIASYRARFSKATATPTATRPPFRPTVVPTRFMTATPPPPTRTPNRPAAAKTPTPAPKGASPGSGKR